MTTPKKSPITTLSLILPFAIFLIGLCLTFVSEPFDTDSLGLSVLVWGLGGFCLAGICSIFLSALALFKKEPKSLWSLLLSLPYTMLILLLGFDYIGDQSRQRSYEKEKNRTNEFTAKIEKGEINVMGVDWSHAEPYELGALSNLASRHSSVLTKETLTQFLEKNPELYHYVIVHPEIPEPELETFFEEAYRSCEEGISYFELSLICKNPSLPENFVERVANSQTLAFGAVLPARKELERRFKLEGKELPTWSK